MSTERMLFLSAVLERWRKGEDTKQIANVLGYHEAEVETALHEAQELERRREGKINGN